MNTPSAQEMTFFSERIKHLWRENKIAEAKKLILEKVSLYPDEYFLWTTLAQASSYLGEYREALGYSQKAISLCNDDVLVLYNHAAVLIDMESYRESIPYCQQILKRSVGSIAQNGEGVKWAKSIRNDTMYLKAIALFYLGDYSRSLRVLKQLLTQRQRGLPSDFSKKQIMRRIKKIELTIAQNKKAIIICE